MSILFYLEALDQQNKFADLRLKLELQIPSRLYINSCHPNVTDCADNGDANTCFLLKEDSLYKFAHYLCCFQSHLIAYLMFSLKQFHFFHLTT